MNVAPNDRPPTSTAGPQRTPNVGSGRPLCAKEETSQNAIEAKRAARRHSVALCLMLGNNDVARCNFVWRQPRLKCHLPGRLPDNADDSASLRSYVVQLIPESHWLIADRMDSVLLATSSGTSRPPTMGIPPRSWSSASYTVVDW
jgi:hypothetical protein